MKKSIRKLGRNLAGSVKSTAEETGLVDRKKIVIKSHRRKSVQRAFWLQQTGHLRDIQATLRQNYDGSKVLMLFCCCCLKEDLKTMIDEAVDDFLSIPKVVMESGHEVPITADLDLDTVNLDPFNFAIPDPSYYSARSVGVLEREKADLKADIVDLQREHRQRYGALHTLASRHRQMRLQNADPSSRALKTLIRDATRHETPQPRVASETAPLLDAHA